MILDEVLPRYDVASRHELRVPTRSEAVFGALAAWDIRGSTLTRLLMRMRGYGRRMRPASRPVPLAEAVAGLGFVPLGADPGRELVFGIAGKFWRPNGCLQKLTAEEFRRFAEPGFAKAAWNLAVSDAEPEGCILTTETRVLCFGAGARRLFRLYWSLIAPFSGLIRLELLKRIRKRAAEEEPS